jgi:hypothetical protein
MRSRMLSPIQRAVKIVRYSEYSSSSKKVWTGRTNREGWSRTSTLASGDYRVEVDGWGSTTVRVNPELDKGHIQIGEWHVLLMDNGCAGSAHIVN